MSKNIKLTVMSSLEKIYNEDNIPEKNYEGFSMLKNERKSFQLAVEVNEDFKGNINIKSDIKNIDIYSVNCIPSDFPMTKVGNDGYYRYSNDNLYPDLLLPVDNYIDFKKRKNVFWFEFSAENITPGEHTIEISVENSSATIKVEIIDCELEFNDFIYTNWFHTDCLMTQYNVEAFSDEYWRIVENYLLVARKYGMNCVLTPIFTPPLDTKISGERPTVQLIDIVKNGNKYSFNFDKLTKWIEMCHRCNIEYFELAHFYTQWGAKHAPKIIATVNGEEKMIFGWKTRASSKKYINFLKQLSVELKKYLETNGLKDKVLIHVSDEPNGAMYRTYKKASATIHNLFEGYKIVDALSDYKFYKKKVVTNPIPATDAITPFIGNVPELWTYYCSSQHNGNVSNRFFCNDSIRNRVLGYQLFKYDVKGFLHWGYNFYYTQYSKKVIDPYKVSDAGGKFPSGDSYVVYPAKDGTPYPSLRLFVFYDALQDFAALNTLSKLSDKKTAMDILEEYGINTITFNEYPHDDEWLLSTRENINMKIKELLKTE